MRLARQALVPAVPDRATMTAPFAPQPGDPMRNFFAAAAVLAMSASPALAIGVYPCGELNRVQNLVGPWGQFSKSFYEGEVLVAVIDTIEPAAAALHLIVLMPPPDGEAEYRPACYAISATAGTEDSYGMGFSGMDWDNLKGDYDPAKGLLLSVPVSIFDGDAGEGKPAGLAKVRINMAERTIKPE